ncbi:hypothetical protein M409DRAFT_19339 [Zasmidium cellare ATCC 36951]|uniref:Carrier domain-containing protein n=1 Tax=Zasmidium cellare ATCC 36951 TaxID=1080233 RepID=A0A6A6CXJ0_ZASCE|nr:uncharacterized protein M409DRAFT_19339 [Zasmidium cellare ATCC 36951]KAF2170519.1 hypothetical protein M409DRAFT_19339 [Zasmidium cellare ATCC 36951]
MDLKYFICTLGQASRHKNEPQDFTNINDFTEEQAHDYPNHPAVGFYNPSESQNQPWRTQVLTFKEVLQGACCYAERLSTLLDVQDKETVALLCPSSPNFLFTWLGAMRLGHPVLLIAPQGSPNAVVELCKQCSCERLIYDQMYKDLALASKAAGNGHGIKLVPLPFKDEEVLGTTKQPVNSRLKAQDVKPSDVAYLHHTSGTSTGIPKPIPQTHHGGAGVYTAFEGSHHATFTTTPLYHGAIADLFRAWTSHALIWLFPGKEAPITATNVVKCLEAAEKAGTPRVEFFSSVPYVLEMLAEDERGLKCLQKTAIVGVGGAALPASVGDGLVERNVNLVSRFGSAECGFLMSSNRDFANDRDWQYLRCDEDEDKLRFEPREDGLSELVVLSGWPHMAKRNRDDGSFATADLLQPHPRIKGAWKYHSRADSQLTLITGKKFDPSPLESAISASTPLLSDVLIFGNGQPHPGALLFRSRDAKEVVDQDVLAEIGPKIEQLNKESQSHARIDRSMLIPMPWTEQPLEKSSKGTILRGKAEERYASNIEAAYKQQVDSLNENVPDDDVPDKVLEIVNTVVNTPTSEPVDMETDLFACGVDSIACVRIRHAVSHLLPKGHVPLPLTVVQDCGTVSKLSQVLIDMRQGKDPDLSETKNVGETMLGLVEQYSHFDLSPGTNGFTSGINGSSHGKRKNILLTGPTGSLGSHLLGQILENPNVHIYLLLRGSTAHAARERVLKALQSRKIPIPNDFDDRLTIHTCALSKPYLGLSEKTYANLAGKIDVIYHLAWSVDFVLPLQGFRQHFTGLQSLTNLALARKPEPAHLIFCSSTASVSNGSSPVAEAVVENPAVSGGIGYSRSKWVAENILLKARQQHPNLNIDIVRAGQLSGDTMHGIWNMSEAYPLMLSSARETRCLPDLGDGEDMRWVPVDLAARAFVELTREEKSHGQQLAVFHVVNYNSETTWRQLSAWIQEDASDVEILSVKEWLRRLEKLKAQGSENPCLKLLEFWKDTYGARDEGSSTSETPSRTVYEMNRTFAAMPAVAQMRSLDRDYVLRLWDWIKAR